MIGKMFAPRKDTPMLTMPSSDASRGGTATGECAFEIVAESGGYFGVRVGDRSQHMRWLPASCGEVSEPPPPPKPVVGIDRVFQEVHRHIQSTSVRTDGGIAGVVDSMLKPFAPASEPSND